MALARPKLRTRTETDNLQKITKAQPVRENPQTVTARDTGPPARDGTHPAGRLSLLSLTGFCGFRGNVCSKLSDRGVEAVIKEFEFRICN